MKIQFIVVGWHYNQRTVIDGLKELKKNNDFIKVFWSCHKLPSNEIASLFEWKLFKNEGLEDGAYQQALDYLNLDEDTILFLMHDDIIIKDWSFIYKCIDMLNDFKVIGNGINYPLMFDPLEIVKSKSAISFVKDKNKHFFTEKRHIKTVRESFICIKYSDLKEIGEFEVIWETPVPDKDGKFHIGGIGNLQQSLLGYKFSSIFGLDKIGYLSSSYVDSEYIYECQRGQITELHPIK